MSCKTPNCANESFQGFEFCAFCLAQKEITVRLKQRKRRKDFFGKFAGFVASAIDPKKPSGQVLGGMAREYLQKAQTVVAARGIQPDPPEEPDIEVETEPPDADACWKVLGIKKKGATEELVRKRQRQLAAIFHEDAGGDEEAEERLKEINVAAAECLKQLKNK